eukprot:5922192-Amphidinium_carterae.1
MDRLMYLLTKASLNMARRNQMRIGSGGLTLRTRCTTFGNWWDLNFGKDQKPKGMVFPEAPFHMGPHL